MGMGNVDFSKYELLNVLFEKIIIISPILEDWDSGTFSELAVIGVSYRCAMAEKQICLHIFFCQFLTPKI